MGDTGNFGILLRHAFQRVDHHHHNIGALHSGDGADNTVSFQFFFDLALSSESCCINENIFPAVVNDGGVYRIPRGSRNI